MRTSIEEAISELEALSGVTIWYVLNIHSSGRPAQEAVTLFNRLKLEDPAVLVVAPDGFPVHGLGTVSVSSCVADFVADVNATDRSADANAGEFTLSVLSKLRHHLTQRSNAQIDLDEVVSLD